MEQRPLRLGDIVDDYCPRERRITNHAIVAIVEDAIRQTRCATCDAEHVYKHAREPVRRRKAAPSADESARPGQLVPPPPTVAEPETPTEVILDAVTHADEAPPRVAADADEAGEGLEGDPPGDDDGWGWPAHRQLIRATLPRVEGEPPAPRPIPEFTMHQRPPSRRGGGVRFGGQGRNGNVTGGQGQGANGNRAPQGPGQGQHTGRSGRRRGHHKRSR